MGEGHRTDPVEGKRFRFIILDSLITIFLAMPIQAASGSPMSGSLAGQSYETFGGIEIRGDDDQTYFLSNDHPIYGQVI